jgi:hypothetical protein
MRSLLFPLIFPALLATVLQGCGGSDGDSPLPDSGPNPPASAWSEPQLLASLPDAPIANIELARANPGGGVSLSWSSVTSGATRHGFVESKAQGTGTVSELPDARSLYGWAWDAAGPTSALGVREASGAQLAEMATWQRVPPAWAAPVPVPPGLFAAPINLSGAARAGGSAIQLVQLRPLADILVTSLGLLRYVPGQGWSAPQVIGNGIESSSNPQVAIGPQDEALVASQAGWRTFTPAAGWSALRAWPFSTGAGFFVQALQADDAGNYYLAAVRCPTSNNPASCDPVVAKYSPAAGWEDPTPIAPGAGFVQVKLHASPAGHLVAWYFTSNGILVPSRVELRVVVRWPGIGWSPYTALAPLQEEFFATAAFVAQDSGRVAGAWNFGRGRIEGAVYTPGVGWSTPQVIQQGPQALTFGRIGVVLDQGVPTAVWGVSPVEGQSSSFYQSRLH